MGKKLTFERADAQLIWWRFDDEITIGSVLKKDKKCKLPALLKNESERNKHSEQLEALISKKDWNVKHKKPRELPVGIEAFSKDYFDSGQKKLTTNDWKAFVDMTQPDWAADDRAVVVKLIAAVLSSYAMRQILDEESEIEVDPVDEADRRALYVTISDVENGFQGLNWIAESIIVSTAVNDGLFKFCAPRILRSKTANTKILDKANLCIKHCDDYRWPAPYRDTAVLLDGRSFKDKDIKEFASLNPWCTCLFYGKTLKLPFGYRIEMKGTAFGRLESCCWDQEAVHALVAQYVAYLPWMFEGEQPLFPTTWVQVGNLIQRYKDTKRKLDGSEKYKIKMLITSILTFLSFAKSACGIKDDEMQPFQKSIVDLFLPGAFKKEGEKPQVVEKPLDIFEGVLKKVLTAENLKHFYHMPGKRGEVWPTTQRDGTEIWGYIRCYEWQKDGAEEPCLILPRNLLRKTIVEEVAPGVRGFSDVLGALKDENVPYIHKTDNAKIKRAEGETPKSEKALRLRISELPIEENVRKMLMTL